MVVGGGGWAADHSLVYKSSLNAPTGATTRDFPSNLCRGAAHDTSAPRVPPLSLTLACVQLLGRLNHFYPAYIRWVGVGGAAPCIAGVQNKSHTRQICLLREQKAALSRLLPLRFHHRTPPTRLPGAVRGWGVADHCVDSTMGPFLGVKRALPPITEGGLSLQTFNNNAKWCP